MGSSDYSELISFFDQNPSCLKALQQLDPGTEILLTVGQADSFTLGFDENKILLEPGKPQKFDVEFIISHEALRRLPKLKGLSLSKVGIEVVKEVLIENIKIVKHTGIVQFLKRGYLKIIVLAGPEFLTFLSKHGFGSVQKIVSFIKNM